MEYEIYSGKSLSPKEYKYFGKTPSTLQCNKIVENLREKGNNVLVLASSPNLPKYARHYLAYKKTNCGGI